MRRLIFDRERIAAWVFERLPNAKDTTDYEAFGIEDDSGIVAGFVVNQYDGEDAQLTVAARSGALWARPKWLRALAHYVFVQLNCQRISAQVDIDNQASRRALERGGFVYEGLKRPRTLLYGMLRKECKYL